MSDEEGMSVEGVEGVDVDSSEQQYLTAEYRDGQLQIVEMTPYERDKEISILPDDTEGGTKFMLGRDENGLVQLDLLNLTLVKCDDGEESYRLVASTDAGEASDLSDATVTCVLQASDGEDPDNQDYVMVESGAEGTLPVYFTTSTSEQNEQSEPESAPTLATVATPTTVAVSYEPPSPPKKLLSPAEILQRAKAMKKARAIMSSVQPVRLGRRGRRAKGSGDLPMARQLLASPQFRLYLYSCKLCSYKCNAVKQLQAHRAEAHSGAGAGAGGAGPAGCRGRRSAHAGSVPCTKCTATAAPRAPVAPQAPTAPVAPVARTLQVKSENPRIFLGDEEITITNRVSLDSKEVEEADVLVCGACGFESGCRDTFRAHIQDAHGAVTT